LHIGCQHAYDNVATSAHFEFSHVVPRVFRRTEGRG
jgi:hypothetical protein